MARIPARRPAKAPQLYRPVLKCLHWGSLAFVILALTQGLTPELRWGFVALCLLWAAGFALWGNLARPGPALTGLARRSFAPLHSALIAALVLCAIMAVQAPDGPLDGPVRLAFLGLLGGGLLHGIFHLWRHTALGDGALRNITPRFLHGIL